MCGERGRSGRELSASVPLLEEQQQAALRSGRMDLIADDFIVGFVFVRMWCKSDDAVHLLPLHTGSSHLKWKIRSALVIFRF